MRLKLWFEWFFLLCWFFVVFFTLGGCGGSWVCVGVSDFSVRFVVWDCVWNCWVDLTTGFYLRDVYGGLGSG